MSVFTFSFSQENSNNSKQEFIEFVVNGETTPELLRSIHKEFNTNPDFQAARMDIPTERFFGVMNIGKVIDLNWFQEIFKGYGLTIHCINTGNVGEVPYQHMAKKDCPEISTKK